MMARSTRLADHISYSEAWLWNSCRRAWQYRYVEDRQTDPDPALRSGAAMHDALAAGNRLLLVRANGNLAIPSFVRTVATDALGMAWEKHEVPWESDYALAQEIIDYEFRDASVREHQSLGDIVAVEHYVKTTLRGVVESTGEVRSVIISGKIDLVLTIDDGVEIRDYKTGASRPGPEGNFQLGLYAAAWETEHDGQDNQHAYAVSLAYPGDENAVHAAAMTDEWRMRSVNWLVAARASIITAHPVRDWPANPDTMRCGRCDYATICPDAPVVLDLDSITT